MRRYYYDKHKIIVLVSSCGFRGTDAIVDEDDDRRYGPPNPPLPNRRICNGVLGVVNGVMGVMGVTVMDPLVERAGERIKEPMPPSDSLRKADELLQW